MPPYDRILVTRQGKVWVQHSRRPGRDVRIQISIFDGDGYWLRDGLLPAGTTPIDIDATSVLASWTDDDGVSHLRVYRLLHSPGTTE
jgi:hypothetical protein